MIEQENEYDSGELDQDMKDLVEEARHLEAEVARSNRLPEEFLEDDVLDLCRVAQLISTSPEDLRPEMLRTLSDELAAMDRTIPRGRETDTGDYEFERLRGAYNGFASKAYVLAGKARSGPPPPDPDEPRNDPNAGKIDALVAKTSETIDAIQESRNEVIANASIAVDGDMMHSTIINFNVNAHLDMNEASALLIKIGAGLRDVTARSFVGLALLLRNWPEHLQNSLKAVSAVFDFTADILEKLKLKKLALISRELSFVAESHARALQDETPDTDEYEDDPLLPHEELTDRLEALQEAMGRNDTAAAMAISSELRKLGETEGIEIVGKINLSKSSVSDLAPLTQLNFLRTIQLRGTNISDLRPIAGLTSLRFLDLEKTRVSDLDPIGRLRLLKSLDLRSTKISDVQPLSKLINLQNLSLRDTEVSDLTPLSTNYQLRSLDIENTSVADIKPLQSLTALEFLNLNNTDVLFLNPLQKLEALKELYLENTPTFDIQPLSSAYSLRVLNLKGTKVDQIRPLLRLPRLRELILPDGSRANLNTLRAQYKLGFDP